MVAFFLDKGLLNREFACTLLSWRHSGFSIESDTRIYDAQARQGLCQYIIRAPLAMQKPGGLSWYGDARRADFHGIETPTGPTVRSLTGRNRQDRLTLRVKVWDVRYSRLREQ